MEDPRRWLLWLRIPLVLTGICVFFLGYDRFLLNANLQNLRVSLSILDTATEVGQAEAALLLVDQTLLAQMGSREPDLATVAALDYTQGMLASDSLKRPVDDAHAMLAAVGQDSKAARPTFLRAMDQAVTAVQSALRTATLFPRKMMGPDTSPEIDPTQLKKAGQLERSGKHIEAADLYHDLLTAYPQYEDRGMLRLRMAYAYQQAEEFGQAELHYRQLLRETRRLDEAQAARQMLSTLSRMWEKRAKITHLEKRLETASEPGLERRNLALQLGSALIQVHAMEPAAAAFLKAFQADPQSEQAPFCLYRQAWCLRRAWKTEAAKELFRKIIQEKPKTRWAAAAQMQIAEIQRSSEDPQAVIGAYEAALFENPDASLAAVTYAILGNMYKFDLNNPEKAQEYFQVLKQRFPASPFSRFQRLTEGPQLSAGSRSAAPSAGGLSAPGPVLPKAPEPPSFLTEAALEENSPLIRWLEGFLPVFVDVFSDRLSKYMSAAGENSLQRKFSEREFQDFVIRQIQQRYPEQVSDMNARITSDGFLGTGNVKLGPLGFPLSVKIDIRVAEQRPLAVIKEVKVGIFSVPKLLLSILETRVNKSLLSGNYPLKVLAYELYDGYALISVQLDDKRQGQERVPGTNALVGSGGSG